MDKNKVFLVQCRALEGRIEPLYHLPTIVRLENQIRKLANGILKDYILSVSSGSTPSMSQESKYYTDAENGIPFLRVQNLSVSGELVLDNVKYINIETHENLLKRSQVGENDLLIKITGVGRMAIASVPPKGFIGNINQHIVVIKTKSKVISQALAAYLNINIAEKLATRRATGGTRPALDYKALKSIPIIFNDEIRKVFQKAYKEKKQKEAEAKKLLASIDSYLLNALGIELPEKPKKETYFMSPFNKLIGSRFDPFYHQKEFQSLEKALYSGKYALKKLKSFSKFQSGYAFSSNDYIKKSNCYLITIKNIKTNRVLLENATFLPDSYFNLHSRFIIKKGDLLIAMTGATIGKVGLFELDKKALLNQRVGIIKPNQANAIFIMSVLNTKAYQTKILRNSNGGAQANISETNIMNLQIPLPPLSEQEKIASHISSLRERAKILQAAASLALAEAKAEVESMILGEK